MRAAAPGIAVAQASSTKPLIRAIPTAAELAQPHEKLMLWFKNLIGKNVYGANGNQVGEVNNLLVGKDGKVHAAIIEFGGFLGIGEDKVAVPWDQLKVTNDRVTVNMSEDQIKAAPRWDQNKPGQFAEYQPLNE